MASERKLTALSSWWLLWAACPTFISKWSFCTHVVLWLWHRAHCRSSGLRLLTLSVTDDVTSESTTQPQLLGRKQLCRCWDSDGDQMSPNKCTRPQELQEEAAAALQSPPQPHNTTGNTSRSNWLLLQGWLVHSASREMWHLHEVTGTDPMVTSPTTWVSSWEGSPGTTGCRCDLFATPKCQHPSSWLKTGRNTNREEAASLELCLCVRSTQAGLGNNWSVNEAWAALLFLPHKLLSFHVTEPILIQLSEAPSGKNSLSFESSC